MVIFLMSMVLSGIVCGQNEQEKLIQREVEEVIVTPPKFTGILKAVPALTEGYLESIQDFLEKNVEYPLADVENYNQGTEVIQFVVSPDGALSEFKVVNSLSRQIDEEVIRVLKTTNGMWIPGQNNGETVAMEKEVSVKFRLTGMPHPLDFEKEGRKYFTRASDLLLNHGNPKKALKFYDMGMRFLPNDESLLMMRGLARYEVGNMEEAYIDWNRLKEIGSNFSEDFIAEFFALKGYEEIVKILSDR